VAVRLAAGSIRIDAIETDRTGVELRALDEAARGLLDDVRVELREASAGAELLVEVPERRGLFGRSPQFALRVRCPLDAHISVRTRSAELEARGRLGSLEARTTSGDVEADEVAGDATVHAVSSDVELRRVGGRAEIQTTSGDVSLGRIAGPLRANTVSGDLAVEDALGPVELTTVSGDQRLEAVNGGAVTLQAVSGDIQVGVRRGAHVWMDVRSLSGDTVSELLASEGPPASDAPLVELRVKTVSGDIRIDRATATVEPVAG
jgi:hypothetical protein